MARQMLFSPGNAFMQGRAARQDYDYGQSRNKLAEMEAANAPQQMERRNKLDDLTLQGAQMDIDAERAKNGYTRLQQALDSGNPKAYVLQREPELVAKLQQQGVDLATLDDQQAAQIIEGFAREYAGKAGIAPAARPVQLETVEGPGGSILQRDPTTGALKQVVGREPTQPRMMGQFIALSPEEVQAAGLPAGTSAQRDMTTGKIDVLSKRDNTSSLSQKDATTAKMKLNTVKLARQQLNNIKQRFGALKGSLSAGAFGQGKIPSEKGRAFDRAVDQMRSTLTSLTRVPGVGAMSDYETKLDQAKFPTRNEYESVTEQQIGDLDSMLNAIESGYSDLLGGSTQEAQPSGDLRPGMVVDGYRYKGGDPGQQSSWVKAQ